MIKDSGNRQIFGTGATRDISEGKGKPTLMPLRVVSKLLGKQTGDYIFQSIAAFTETGETRYLYAALLRFVAVAYSGETETMILETAIHFEEGAKKYPPGEDGTPNWQLGIPVNCYLDSAIRHYLKYRRGDNDEPHDRAFVWNIMCCIWEVDYHENKNHQD
jgi:hypothetical protein